MSEPESTPSTGSSSSYYLAVPTSGKGKPVLVLHAWWGLTQFIKEFCDRLAQKGFVALAPDLYHGEVAATIEEADELSSKLEQALVAKEIFHAAGQLRSSSGMNTNGIGVVGFSLGGFLALWLASQRFNPVVATVAFYATGNDDYAMSHSAFQFHLAVTDPYEPPANVEQLQNSLRAAGKAAEFYTYPGTTHWFFESDRPDAYNADAAQLAWDRTVEFLQAHIEET